MAACQQEERAAGRPYPRTCPTCKLGPCQRPPAPFDAIPTALPPLNTPIQHTGGGTCPVDAGCKVKVSGRLWEGEVTGIAGELYWLNVTTYTIIARAPADRIKELEAALAAIADPEQVPSHGDPSVLREYARAALKGATE